MIKFKKNKSALDKDGFEIQMRLGNRWVCSFAIWPNLEQMWRVDWRSRCICFYKCMFMF